MVSLTPQTLNPPSLCCHFHPWFVTLVFTEKNRSHWKRTILLSSPQIHQYQHPHTSLFCYQCLSASEASTSLCPNPIPTLLLRDSIHLQFHALSCIIYISTPSFLFILQKISSLSVSSKSSCHHLYVLLRPFLRTVSTDCFQFFAHIHSFPIPFSALLLCFDLPVARSHGTAFCHLFDLSAAFDINHHVSSWDTVLL